LILSFSTSRIIKGVAAVVWVNVLVLLTALFGQDQSKAQEEQQPLTGPQSPAKPPTASAASVKKSTGSSPAPSAPLVKKSSATNPLPHGPGLDADVRVRTKAEMRKPKSPFLVAPDSSPEDRYDPDGAVDWSDVSPWRQTSFFGIRARGLFFVYVVDCSGSMIDDDRMPRATIELRRSVMALREPQRFEVIFYNSESIPMPGGPIPRSATLQAKSQLRSFLQLIDPDGGTDPRPAMKQALSLRPDAVFLLSDGAFPDGTVEELTRLNKHKVPIHCVDLTGGLAGDHLKRIAAANGGQYASRMGDLQGRP
jgi:von Willebrand factor type A domain